MILLVVIVAYLASLGASLRMKTPHHNNANSTLEYGRGHVLSAFSDDVISIRQVYGGFGDLKLLAEGSSFLVLLWPGDFTE